MAPATELDKKPTLLVVAHGERGGNGLDWLAHALAADLAKLPDFADASACFISKEPSLKQNGAILRDNPVVIYPLFMSNGYFVKTAIPRALSNTSGDNRPSRFDVTVLRPMGIHARLPEIVSDLSWSTATASRLAPADCTLLLAAHGSKYGDASRRTTETIATTIARTQCFASVAVSFLEERPFLDEQLQSINGPIIVVGLFAGEGMHGLDDVQAAATASNRPDIVVAPQLTRCAGLFNLALDDVKAQVAPHLVLQPVGKTA